MAPAGARVDRRGARRASPAARTGVCGAAVGLVARGGRGRSDQYSPPGRGGLACHKSAPSPLSNYPGRRGTTREGRRGRSGAAGVTRGLGGREPFCVDVAADPSSCNHPLHVRQHGPSDRRPALLGKSPVQREGGERERPPPGRRSVATFAAVVSRGGIGHPRSVCAGRGRCRGAGPGRVCVGGGGHDRGDPPVPRADPAPLPPGCPTGAGPGAGARRPRRRGTHPVRTPAPGLRPGVAPAHQLRLHRDGIADHHDVPRGLACGPADGRAPAPAPPRADRGGRPHPRCGAVLVRGRDRRGHHPGSARRRLVPDGRRGALRCTGTPPRAGTCRSAVRLGGGEHPARRD